MERAQRYSHVLDGAAEGVCDRSIVNGLLAEAEVS